MEDWARRKFPLPSSSSFFFSTLLLPGVVDSFVFWLLCLSLLKTLKTNISLNRFTAIRIYIYALMDCWLYRCPRYNVYFNQNCMAAASAGVALYEKAESWHLLAGYFRFWSRVVYSRHDMSCDFSLGAAVCLPLTDANWGLTLCLRHADFLYTVEWVSTPLRC